MARRLTPGGMRAVRGMRWNYSEVRRYMKVRRWDAFWAANPYEWWRTPRYVLSVGFAIMVLVTAILIAILR